MNYRYGLIVIMVALPLILASQLPTYTVGPSTTLSTTLQPGSLKALGTFSFNYNTSEALIEVNATQVSGNFDLVVYNGTEVPIVIPPANATGFVYNVSLSSAASGPKDPTSIVTDISPAYLARLKPIIKQELSGGKISYAKVTPSYKLFSILLAVNSTEASGRLTAVIRAQTIPVPSYYFSAGLALLLIGLVLFGVGLTTRFRR
ncbi:hypothetical protein PQ610_01860 [Tardisphaera miroshnichenkoae]